MEPRCFSNQLFYSSYFSLVLPFYFLLLDPKRAAILFNPSLPSPKERFWCQICPVFFFFLWLFFFAVWAVPSDALFLPLSPRPVSFTSPRFVLHNSERLSLRRRCSSLFAFLVLIACAPLTLLRSPSPMSGSLFVFPLLIGQRLSAFVLAATRSSLPYQTVFYQRPFKTERSENLNT